MISSLGTHARLTESVKRSLHLWHTPVLEHIEQSTISHSAKWNTSLNWMHWKVEWLTTNSIYQAESMKASWAKRSICCTLYCAVCASMYSTVLTVSPTPVFRTLTICTVHCCNAHTTIPARIILTATAWITNNFCTSFPSVTSSTCTWKSIH